MMILQVFQSSASWSAGWFICFSTLLTAAGKDPLLYVLDWLIDWSIDWLIERMNEWMNQRRQRLNPTTILQ
jgi:hypothetical protein